MEGRKGRGQIGVIGAVTCSPELSAIVYEVGGRQLPLMGFSWSAVGSAG